MRAREANIGPEKLILGPRSYYYRCRTPPFVVPLARPSPQVWQCSGMRFGHRHFGW